MPLLRFNDRGMTEEGSTNLERRTETNTARVEGREVDKLIQNMRDYCQVGIDLVWQRQITFAAALALAAYYYDVRLAGIVLVLITISELFDFWLFKRILNWTGNDRQTARRFLYLLYFSTLLSASVIVMYSIGLAVLQGPTTHFMSLFFLFAAALFAAMNNHQVLSVLVIRLSIYGFAFLFIPIRDIVIAGAPLGSELWAQFFTSVVVLFFIIDSSRNYLRFYRTQLAQMDMLRAEHEKTRIAYNAKSEFVSTMSHELRTPLTSIKGAVEMVNSGKLGALPEKVSTVLDVAQRNCARLLDLINEILDLQKLESGNLSFSLQKIDLRSVVSDAVSDNQPYASKLGVSITAAIPEQPIWAHVDEVRMHQVFTNILSNAAKFSPAGTEVRVFVKTDRGKVRVHFRDEGVGLSDSDADKVFDRFTQLDSSDTRRSGGTGLGMNISKHIMEAHGGLITYSKNAGAGTTFVVELPLP